MIWSPYTKKKIEAENSTENTNEIYIETEGNIKLDISGKEEIVKRCY